MNNFEQIIENARQREINDDHLSTEERGRIIETYAEYNQNFERSGDIDRDFMDIIF